MASSSGDLVVVFSRRSPRLLTLTLARRSKNRRSAKSSNNNNSACKTELVPDVRAVPWFADRELRPRCVALAPSEDFAAVATAGGEIFVAPTKLLAPGFASREEEKQERDCNFRSWSDSSLTALPSKDLSSRLCHSLIHQQQQSPKEGGGGSSSNKGSVEPTAMLWWTTQDFA